MNIYHIKILFFILNISIIFSCKANNKFSDKAGLSDKSNYAIVIYETNNDNLHVYNTIFTDDLNTYSGAYPPTNSGRIRSARAAIKSVIPADMHPF